MAKIHESDSRDLPKEPKARAKYVRGLMGEANEDPMEESKDEEDGELDGIHVTPADNGYSVRTTHTKQHKEHGKQYHEKTHVFPDKHGVLAHLGKKMR
jgi:hypothetical protein